MSMIWRKDRASMADTAPPVIPGDEKLIRRNSTVVRNPLLRSADSNDRRWRVLVAAFLISGVVHMALGFTVFGLPTQVNAGAAETEMAVIIETKVEDNTAKPPDLTNEEIGNDPDVMETNFDVKNLNPDVSVPGVVKP